MTVSQQYVDAVNAADGDTLLALFADGAVLHHPLGTYTGRDERTNAPPLAANVDPPERHVAARCAPGSR